jgi:hypothetical protein
LGDKIEKNEIGRACSAYEEKRGVCGILVGNLRERNYLGDPGVDGRLMEWIFRTWDVGMWTGSSWLRTGTGGGYL